MVVGTASDGKTGILKRIDGRDGIVKYIGGAGREVVPLQVKMLAKIYLFVVCLGF